MTTTHSITLAGSPREIGALPYGRLKKILPAMNRCRLGGVDNVTETMMSDFGVIIAAALGITPEQFDEMSATIDEVTAAIPVIAEACGLTPKVATPGEAQPG
jgi:hypothetical protein